MIIQQQRYMLPEQNVTDTTKWFVPLSIATQKREPNDEVPEYWLSNTKHGIVIENVVDDADYIYVNLNRTGYYRVNYDITSWKRLLMNFHALPEITRAQLLDDAFQLARAEFVDYEIPLTLCLMMTKNPVDHLSWWAFSNGIGYLTNMVRREPAFESYRAVMRYFIKIAYTELGFPERENENHVQLSHRANIVRLACDFDWDRCTNQAQLIYREWMTNPLDNK